MIPVELEHISSLYDAEVSEVELNSRLLLETSRIGKFTCSEFHKLMTYENKIDDFPKGAETVVIEKVSEVMTDTCSFSDDWTSDAMQWGKDHELEAVERFTQETGIKVKKIGTGQEFIEYSGEIDDILIGNTGGTPDGDIDEKTGLEVKCPSSKVHLGYGLGFMPISNGAGVIMPTLKEVEKKYYWQVQGYMMLTGKESWYFMSYDPRFKNKAQQVIIAKVDRCETDIQKLKVRLRMAVQKKNEILNQLITIND